MKVFLADDHPIVIEGYKALLGVNNINIVGSAKNGHEIITWLENNFCDILLLDISMPVISGIDILKHLIKIESKVKVIMVTSYHEGRMIQETINLGAKGYVLKDQASSCIVEAIQDVYNGKTYFSPGAKDAIIDMQLKTSEEVSITDMLSTKETEILMFLLDGYDSKGICDKMEIEPSTLRSNMQRARSKMNVKNNIQLALVAIKHKYKLFKKT